MTWRAGPMLLVVGMLGAASCGGGATAPARSQTSTKLISSSGGSVTSTDGHLTLTVPDGALNQPTAISIRVLDAAAWPKAFQRLPPVGAVYSLEPNGLRFSAPVSLALSHEPSGPPYPIPVMVSVSGATGPVDPLAAQSSELDLSSRTLVSQSTTTHFSDLAEFDLDSYDLTPPMITASIGSTWPGKLHLLNPAPYRARMNGDAESTSSGAVGLTVENLVAQLAIISGGTASGVTVDLGPWLCTNAGSGTFGAEFTLRGVEDVLDGKGRFHHAVITAIATNVKVIGPATCTAGAATTTAPTTVSVSARPTALQAWFDQGTFSTYYTEPVTQPGWSYMWSVSIPTDPNCATGFHRGVPSPDKATWFHANVTEGGPCNHSGSLYSPTTGHPGVVTLVVTPADHAWKCQMVFGGTAPNNQDPKNQAVGSSPQCN